jgi:hypothetical protein
LRILIDFDKINFLNSNPPSIDNLVQEIEMLTTPE